MGVPTAGADRFADGWEWDVRKDGSQEQRLWLRGAISLDQGCGGEFCLDR